MFKRGKAIYSQMHLHSKGKNKLHVACLLMLNPNLQRQGRSIFEALAPNCWDPGAPKDGGKSVVRGPRPF